MAFFRRFSISLMLKIVNFHVKWSNHTWIDLSQRADSKNVWFSKIGSLFQKLSWNFEKTTPRFGFQEITLSKMVKSLKIEHFWKLVILRIPKMCNSTIFDPFVILMIFQNHAHLHRKNCKYLRNGWLEIYEIWIWCSQRYNL
jgi:hypothetical protein